MALVGTDVTPNTIPAPDQSGGATWGTIAVPQAGLYSPGYADIGAQAFETGQSALRARNLSVFNAYTQLNPGASPQDLADAAQRISGGDNWITGDSQAPALYKAISDKNRLTLEAQQTAQKTDISSAIEAALQKSALTASDAKDWMQKAKSQLPQSAWAAVDAYLGPQNTEAKFNTYQQARVQNAVDIGIKNEWTLDNYKAYFNDDRLAKMAMDMSQTQIKNAQDTLKSKLNLEGAQASSAAADARLRQAQALVEPTIGQENLARAAYETAQTKELQANTEKTVNDIEQT